MVSELDKLEAKIAIPVVIVVVIGYFIYNEKGIFIAGAVLLTLIVCASIYFLLETMIPPKNASIDITEGNCKVYIECSEFNINRKPLSVVLNEKNIIATIYRGSKITLQLPEGDCIKIESNNKSSSSYKIEKDMKLYVWIEPLPNLSIQVEKFYAPTPPKDKAYEIYKKTDGIVKKFTVPVIIFGTIAIIIMLWKSNLF